MNTLNKELKLEANKLLEMGLYDLLSKYGDVVFTGSYSLDLMVWRDLDIYVDVKRVSQEDIYNLMTEIFNIYRPVWAETKDTHLEESGCPKGYFVGFETKLVKNKLWNVDLWFTDNEYINNNISFIENIKSNLNDDKRRVIIDIKKELYNHESYGHSFFSVDVYEAVIEYNINNIKDFKKWLKVNKNVTI